MRVLLAFLLALLPAAVLACGPDTKLDRQSLRASQHTMTRAEMREAERRLDAIDRKAHRDPAAARQELFLYQADRALSESLASTRKNTPPPGE